MKTNLPTELNKTIAENVKLFYDSTSTPLEFLSTDVDSAITFFQSRGFDKDAATITALTILKQAKIEGTPVYQILDTLKGFTSLQISSLVGEILNNNRPSTSTLGFKIAPATSEPITRNILV